MPSHRWVALVLSTGLLAMMAACEADPGTLGPRIRYGTTSTTGGGEGGLGGVMSVSSAGGGGMGVGGAGGSTCECADGLSCCGDACVNLANDILNCGTCGNQCDAPLTCINGECQNPCAPDFGCEEGLCCGTQCCDAGALCCDYGTPEMRDLHCQLPVNGTCPIACTGCMN